MVVGKKNGEIMSKLWILERKNYDKMREEGYYDDCHILYKARCYAPSAEEAIEYFISHERETADLQHFFRINDGYCAWKRLGTADETITRDRLIDLMVGKCSDWDATEGDNDKPRVINCWYQI